MAFQWGHDISEIFFIWMPPRNNSKEKSIFFIIHTNDCIILDQKIACGGDTWFPFKQFCLRLALSWKNSNKIKLHKIYLTESDQSSDFKLPRISIFQENKDVKLTTKVSRAEMYLWIFIIFLGRWHDMSILYNLLSLNSANPFYVW